MAAFPYLALLSVPRFVCGVVPRASSIGSNGLGVGCSAPQGLGARPPDDEAQHGGSFHPGGCPTPTRAYQRLIGYGKI